MSFLLDPPLLVASGAAIERSGLAPERAESLKRATVGVFVGVSLALYANAPGMRVFWGPFGSRSGREFMLTSGLASVDESEAGPLRHAAALSLFALYPLWLQLGVRFARR